MPDSEYSEAHLDLMRSSYADFALGIHPEWERAYFQTDIIAPMLERITMGDPAWRRTMLFEPFRYSKTSYAVDCFVPWYLGLNPTHPVIQVSYGRELAKTSGTNIREIMASELYRELFPESALAPHSKASTEFGTVSGGRYYAGSFATGVNGRGARMLLVSDPHKNLEELKDPTLAKVRKIFVSAVMRRCEPNAMVLLETARWAPYDLAGWRLDQDGGWDVVANEPYRDDENDKREPHPKPIWKVMRLRAEAEYDEGWRGPDCPCGLKDYDGNLIPHGMPLWPGHWTCEDHLAVKREDATVWDASYQLRPTLAGGYMLAKTPPQYYETIDATHMNTYIIVDPSVGKGRKSDRTAIGVIGTAEDGNYYLLDLVWDRLTENERMDHIFRLHRKWRPKKVGYEQYGAQTDDQTLRSRMEAENYRFVITILGRSGQWHSWAKPDRIKQLVSPAASGKIWLPDPKSNKTTPEMARMIQRFVDKEWNKYPGSSYDDVLDMLARIKDPDLGIVFPRPAQRNAPARAYRPAGTSWMAN